MIAYDDLRRECDKAIGRRARRTGARLNVSYTSPDDLAADAWILMQERSEWDTRRAADEAVRRALRAQMRHAVCYPIEDPEQVRAPEVEIAAGLPPVLQRIADGWTLAEIAQQTGRSVSAVWRQADKEKRALIALYTG